MMTADHHSSKKNTIFSSKMYIDRTKLIIFSIVKSRRKDFINFSL